MQIHRPFFPIRFVVAFLSVFYAFTAWLFGETLFFLSGRRKERNFNLTAVQRVLIARVDKIGDGVILTPFLRELRRNLPRARITLLANSLVYNLMECCPYLDEVVNTGRSGERALNILIPPLGNLFFGLRRLWKEKFDLALVPRWDMDLSQATFSAYFSGALWRAGYSEKVSVYKSWSNKGYDRLLTHVCRDSSLKHEVERRLELIRFLGGRVEAKNLELWSKREDEIFVNKIFETCRISPENIVIVFCPGAYLIKRAWPLDNFLQLGDWLKKNFNCTIFMIGGKKERRMGEEISARFGSPSAVDLVDKMSLRQTYALLKRTHLYVGNDTGGMHLAAAAGIPIVEISCHPKSASPINPNAPERVGPWTDKKIILQPQQPLAPCADECSAKVAHCITQITVEQVASAVERFLGQIH